MSSKLSTVLLLQWADKLQFMNKYSGRALVQYLQINPGHSLDKIDNSNGPSLNTENNNTAQKSAYRSFSSHTTNFSFCYFTEKCINSLKMHIHEQGIFIYKHSTMSTICILEGIMNCLSLQGAACALRHSHTSWILIQHISPLK